MTDPKKPEMLSQIPVPENTHSHKVKACDDVILVNNEQLGGRKPFEAGIRIYDISDPSDPTETSFFETGGRGIHRFWYDCETRRAYISTETDGYIGAIFMVADVSDPR